MRGSTNMGRIGPRSWERKAPRAWSYAELRRVREESPLQPGGPGLNPENYFNLQMHVGEY